MYTIKKRNLILKTLAVFIFTVSLFTLSISPAVAGPGHDTPSGGEVVSSVDSGGYTYIEVKDGGETFWLAAPTASVQKGDKINFAGGMWMPNFKSKALDKTFDRILFVDGISLGAGGGGMKVIAPTETKKKKAAKIKYKKPHKMTIKEIYAEREDLDGSKVKVKGTVVKVSKMIMGVNWIHIQDGTGDSADGSNNLIFRSSEAPNVSDKVTATGTINVDRDFGAGYFYPAIAEDSTFK